MEEEEEEEETVVRPGDASGCQLHGQERPSRSGQGGLGRAGLSWPGAGDVEVVEGEEDVWMEDASRCREVEVVEADGDGRR